MSYLIAHIDAANPAWLLAVFFVVTAADIGFVLPALFETVIFYVTFHDGPLSLNLLFVVIASTAGRQAGTGVVYALSRLWRDSIRRWLSRRIPFLERQVERFEGRLAGRQALVLTIARLTPGLLQASTVAAGTMRTRYSNVALAAVISGAVYDGVLIALGTLARFGFGDVSASDSIWISFGFGMCLFGISLAVGFIRSRSARAKG